MRKLLVKITGFVVGMLLITTTAVLPLLVFVWAGILAAFLTMPIVIYCAVQFADWFFRKLNPNYSL
jgi:hypothetical protein